MNKPPQIKKIDDFEDPVDYCFYLLGYSAGIRSDLAFQPEAENLKAYDSGVYDGQLFICWFLLMATLNPN